MTFTPDSALVDSVLPAEAYDRRGAPILAPVIHMAEGGGTDTWLARPDGNSSHYTIKYSGKLVQQVPESKAAGSMNPRATRSGDDKAFTQAGVSIRYGRTALNAVLGAYAPIYVNRAVIAIEIEGLAADGPNAAQIVTLVSLVKDIIRRRPSVRGLLGHRDQQDYKPCPGKFIPWNLLGGHGILAPERDDVKFIQVSGTPRVLRLPAEAQLYWLDRTPYFKTGSARDWAFVGLADGHLGEYVIEVPTGRPYPNDDAIRPTHLLAKSGTLVAVEEAPPLSVKYPVTVRVGDQTVEGSVTLP